MSAPPSPTRTGLQERSGCLTSAGLAVLRAAEAGQAPPELAVHLAGCARCQEKALAVDAPRRIAGRRGSRSVAPSMGRSLLLVVLVLGAIIAALVTLRNLAGRP